MEIPGRNPAQIENRQQSVQAPGAPGPFRQNIRLEPDSGAFGRAAVARFRLVLLDRPDAGLEGANRVVAVTNHSLTAIRKHKLGIPGKKRLEFRLDRLGDQAARASLQDSVSGSSIPSFWR